MLFNSFHYLWFFPLVVLLYYLLPHRARWVLLLLASYYFYMCWNPVLIVLIVFSTAVNFFFSLKIDGAKTKRRRKRFLWLSVAVNFGLLFVFKYLIFVSDSLSVLFGLFHLPYPVKEFDIVLPMGISFYTFQAAAYTFDVYLGKIRPVRHYGKFSLFISFFPQLVAGPIERSENLLPQFYEKHRFSLEQTAEGLRVMLWGFFKKVVIADRLAIAVDTVYNSCHYFQGLPLVLATVLFAIQIYCDFSGYSDIAMGSARILGFSLMQNFKRPYLSDTVRNYWRNWHISLSGWFMDYIYIPLGGNRKGKLRQYRNLFVTFLVSGLWHGANWTYVLWGALHGVYVVMGNITAPVRKRLKAAFGQGKNPISNAVFYLIGVGCTVFFVCFAFVLFRANSIADAAYIYGHLLWDFHQWTNPQYLYTTLLSMGLNLYEFALMAVALLVLFGGEILGGANPKERLRPLPFLLRGALYAFLLTFVLIAGVYDNAGAFIYFQF